MDGVKDLQAKAAALRSLLEQYAPYDADVKEAYGWVSSLLDAVDSGNAGFPMKFPFGWIFFRGENSLLAYPDLCGAAADFANALEGDGSGAS